MSTKLVIKEQRNSVVPFVHFVEKSNMAGGR